jgi:exopolyphosphatase/guanosine-5'-triphosphate,3'-diphosphate pyrophosphatase
LVTRFSLELYDALQTGGLLPSRSVGAVSPRDLLQVAALTHGAGHNGRNKARHKVSSRLLQKLDVPPDWSPKDVAIAALVARYHRGTLPTAQESDTALSPEDQHMVDCLGGILRFADSLDSEHDHTISTVAVSLSDGRIEIIANGYVPRSKQAEKIAAARHILEYAFNQSLLVRESKKRQTASRRPSTAIA